MSPRDPLQQLSLFDSASSQFHDQFCNVIYGEGYKESVSSLRDDDLVRFIDYLDKVCCRTAYPHPLSG